MAKNANVSNGTLPIHIGKKKPKVIGNIKGIKVNKVIKRPTKVIENIKGIKVNKVIKRPTKVIGNIEEPKANRVIKTPEEVKIDGKRKRYVNPITLSYVLRPAFLAALCKIKKKDEE